MTNILNKKLINSNGYVERETVRWKITQEVKQIPNFTKIWQYLNNLGTLAVKFRLKQKNRPKNRELSLPEWIFLGELRDDSCQAETLNEFKAKPKTSFQKSFDNETMLDKTILGLYPVTITLKGNININGLRHHFSNKLKLYELFDQTSCEQYQVCLLYTSTNSESEFV